VFTIRHLLLVVLLTPALTAGSITDEKTHGALAELAVPDDAAEFSEAEYRRHLAQRALELMKVEFPPAMWPACWEHVVHGRPAAEVAAELGIAVGTVYVAKSRVLARLRQELDGLLD
jgi:RNA polymerase sigma-70 factor (ECF subfamily)